MQRQDCSSHSLQVHGGKSVQMSVHTNCLGIVLAACIRPALQPFSIAVGRHRLPNHFHILVSFSPMRFIFLISHITLQTCTEMHQKHATLHPARHSSFLPTRMAWHRGASKPSPSLQFSTRDAQRSERSELSKAFVHGGFRPQRLQLGRLNGHSVKSSSSSVSNRSDAVLLGSAAAGLARPFA